jgi:hypothetical protein
MVVASKHRTGLLLGGVVERVVVAAAAAENSLLGESAGIVVSVDFEPRKIMDALEALV